MKKLEKLTLKELEFSLPLLEKSEKNSLIAGSGCNPFSLAYYYLGTSEIAGPDSNQDIIDFFSATSYQATSDETPWCSAFVNYCVYNSGGTGTNSAAASSWQSWGTATSSPQVGDIAVANDGSHVGIVEGINPDGSVRMISGNYSNSVAESDVSTSTYSFRTAN